MDFMLTIDKLRQVAAKSYDDLAGLIGHRYKRNRFKNSRNQGLALLLPPPWPPSTVERMELLDKVHQELAEMSSESIMCLHYVTKHLKFWRTRAQGERNAKLRFALLERGPWAFGQGSVALLLGLFDKKPTIDLLVSAASTRITDRITILSLLQSRIAAILAQIHKEVDKLGEEVKKGQARQAVAASLLSIHKTMCALNGFYRLPEAGDTQEADRGSEEEAMESTTKIQMEDFPQDLVSKQEWSDEEIESGLRLLHRNQEMLEDSLAGLMSGYRRPRWVVRHWVRFTCGGLVAIACLAWLFQHSRLGGSEDLERWLREGFEAVCAFLKDHVEQPALSIKDELFETFRKRHRGAVELEDVQMTAESLRRMLTEFVEHVAGHQVDGTMSEQDLMQIMIARYENEIPHPLKNVIAGELVRSLLIQVQKLKLDIETAMLELNQILRANEINFAILAGLPALMFLGLLGYSVRWSLSQRKSAEGRGRAAQLYRRMLVAEAERKVIYIQVLTDKGEEEESHWQFGMLIYLLDRLSWGAKKAAQASGEWKNLRVDLLDLAKPQLPTQYKLVITARMERLYECLHAVPKL